MGEMRYLDPVEGDVAVIWDPIDPESVEKAKKEFEALQELGYE